MQENGLPQAELNYRKRIMTELKDFYSKSVRELTEEDTE